jgi:hypothetical protein
MDRVDQYIHYAAGREALNIQPKGVKTMKDLLKKYERLYREASDALPESETAMVLYLNKVDQLVGWSNW